MYGRGQGFSFVIKGHLVKGGQINHGTGQSQGLSAKRVGAKPPATGEKEFIYITHSGKNRLAKGCGGGWRWGSVVLEFIWSKMFGSRKWDGNTSRELIQLYKMGFFVFRCLAFGTKEKIKVTGR